MPDNSKFAEVLSLVKTISERERAHAVGVAGVSTMEIRLDAMSAQVDRIYNHRVHNAPIPPAISTPPPGPAHAPPGVAHHAQGLLEPEPEEMHCGAVADV